MEDPATDTPLLPDDNPFSDKTVRNGFIRKVYLILLCQLLITTGVTALFLFVPSVQAYAVQNTALLWSALICYVVLVIVLGCCPGVQRAWPWNMLALLAITVALSYLVGTITATYTVSSVLMALGICSACCLAISLFAMNTKYDFTSCYGYLFMIFFVLFLWGMLFMPFVPGETIQKVYAGIGAVVFMLYLAADTQLIMGRHSLRISEEDYVFGALTLYLDIVNIFLFMLTLFGDRR